LKYTIDKNKAIPYGSEILKICFIYDQSKANQNLTIFLAYQKLSKVLNITATTQTAII
jgi:hypothetical protein